MIPVSSVQVSGVSYDNLGEAGLEFLSEMAAGGGKARVLTTLNPAGMDLAVAPRRPGGPGDRTIGGRTVARRGRKRAVCCRAERKERSGGERRARCGVILAGHRGTEGALPLRPYAGGENMLQQVTSEIGRVTPLDM